MEGVSFQLHNNHTHSGIDGLSGSFLKLVRSLPISEGFQQLIECFTILDAIKERAKTPDEAENE